jgi:adenylyl-sulfate kinase
LTQLDRSTIKGHKPAVLWFTGLSGSGKSTIANEVEKVLNKQFGCHTYLLDGDNIRKGINADLGFSNEERQENIRRIGEVVKLFFDAGLIVLSSFISPFQSDRDRIRTLIPEKGFIEIFVDCPIDICQQRDPKGLYQKAINGEIRNFTGISSPYEPPTSPEIHIASNENTIIECANKVINYLIQNEFLNEEGINK